MSMSIELHNISKITAEACHGDDVHWVDLTCEFKSRFRQQDPSTIILFFNEGWRATAFAAAIKRAFLLLEPETRVARNTAELMQQLRDSVALCDAGRAP